MQGCWDWEEFDLLKKYFSRKLVSNKRLRHIWCFTYLSAKTGEFSTPRTKTSNCTQQKYPKWKTTGHSSKNLKHRKTTKTFVFGSLCCLSLIITVWSLNGDLVLAMDRSLAFHTWSYVFTLHQYLENPSFCAEDINRNIKLCAIPSQ